MLPVLVQMIRHTLRPLRPFQPAFAAVDAPEAPPAAPALLDPARPRTDRIVEVLQATAAPMKVPDVVGRLRLAGDATDREIVSATLSHLKRRGRVSNPARGWWAA